MDDGPPVTDASVRSTARTDVLIPEPPFWGARELDIDLDDVFPYLDRHVLFKLHWGGRGVKGEEWERLVGEDFQPRLERMWREQDYLHPRARLGYFPGGGGRQRAGRVRPGGPRARDRAARASRASPSTTASAWPTSSGRSPRASATWWRCRA